MFKTIKRILKNPSFGRYPACDHLNYAIQILLENPDDNVEAIKEILYAIFKANGYLYEHLKPELKKIGLEGLVSSIEYYENR